MTDAPRLESCYFTGSRPDDPFGRMADVLRATVDAHCPRWQARIEPFVPTPRTSSIGLQSHVSNAQKIERWTAIVQASADGTRLLLIDTDTAVLRPLDDVWDQPFDFAYTTKRRPFPFNLGVLFLRVSEPVRTFFAAWRDENLRMLEEKGDHRWRLKYGGINQASFGRLLERGALAELQVQTLPCAEWNCEESGWPTFNPDTTRILHVKGALRKVLFHRRFVSDDLDVAADAYRALEASILRRSA